MGEISEFNDDSLRQIAREVVRRRVALNAHIWAYIFVNIVLFVINYLVDYSYPWHLWAITGWGMALVIHLMVYMFYKKGIENLSTLTLIIHVVIYLIVNIFLIFIAWFTNEAGTGIATWVWYPVGFWALLIGVHLVIYFYITPKKGEPAHKSWVDRKIDEELKKIQTNKKP